LMRKGRFDEVFFVDLPNFEARKAIWTVHLKRRKRNPADFHLDDLAIRSEGFSGAEIEQAVIAGLYSAFSERRQMSTNDLLSEVQATRPLSILMREKVESLRRWSENRCVSAD
jgi:SpoVK/Ycf46/Vps4 family AAA+-type ATPase